MRLSDPRIGVTAIENVGLLVTVLLITIVIRLAVAADPTFFLTDGPAKAGVLLVTSGGGNDSV